MNISTSPFSDFRLTSKLIPWLLQRFGCPMLLAAVLAAVANAGTTESAVAKADQGTQTATASASIQVAGELVVSLDARDPSAGTTNWVNKGTMGNFMRFGSPKLAKVGGAPAVQFNGTNDAYRSEKQTPSNITGAHARSIEVWALNPDLDSTEECMVAWGHRGATLANMAFNYGSGGGFSAVTHYDQDMSWGEESPAAGRWHHLVYTYDGKTSKIYDNAIERASQEFALVTASTNRMNIAVENSADGEPLFQSEWDPNWSLSLSGFIAIVRVHSGSLTPEQVKANFNGEKARFGITGK